MQNMERTGVGMLTTFKTKVLCSPKRSQLFNYKTSEPSGSKTAEIYIYTKVEVQRKCPSICQVYQQDIPVAKQNLQRFPKKRRKKRHGCSPRFLTIASSLGTPQQVSIKAGLRVSMIKESCRSSKELPSRVESWQRL